MYWALFGVGAVLSIIGGIWLLILCFKESVLWGLGALFIPFVSLIFAITHWDVAAKPFLIAVAGGILMAVGAIVFGPEVATTTAIAFAGRG